ncbi:Centrosomal protein poc5 [Desmophyllum pertusum]|uniref:Centrosomal protein POC5 n=1 Tax=Desmophyllum pertusum TaxID=174260 RepID=A0A9X0DD93_9CNID|nr:Centrosomal protein poc5 [Desmophyllum pertusum]
MKKAFMRGVCALNLEAMSMFREGEEGGRRPPAAVNNGAEDMPRHQPPLPTVTTSGPTVTQHQLVTVSPDRGLQLRSQAIWERI